MEKVINFKRQNKLQEKAEQVYRIFRPLNCGLPTYVPRSIKTKLKVGGAISVLCLLTVGTNWIILLIAGWVLK